jgi:L-rhamnose-H+ transport protein
MNAWMGFLLVILAGITTGTYFLGLKYVEPWKWENIWLVYAVLALLVMPGVVAFATVPHIGRVFTLAPGDAIWRVFLFGAGWGIGSVLSGLGVVRMGMAMGVSVLIGIDAALGSFVPMAINNPEVILRKKGLMVIVAVLTLLVGVALVGIAGKKREVAQASAQRSTQQGSFITGLVICIFSGIFSAMMNFAFAFSQPIVHSAAGVGIGQASALNVVWLLALLGGFVPTGIYTGYLLTQNKTWRNYRLPKTKLFWLIGAGMALLWYLGVILYGQGAADMGTLGAVIGWPLFMAVLILASSVSGFATGEWKECGSQAKRWMAAGLVVLMLASVMLGVANQI